MQIKNSEFICLNSLSVLIRLFFFDDSENFFRYGLRVTYENIRLFSEMPRVELPNQGLLKKIIFYTLNH